MTRSFQKIPLHFLWIILLGTGLKAQTNYNYTVDLTSVKNDQLMVELVCPKINASTTVFYFPKIVPGTYMNSNYGKYIHDLQAFDRSGKMITVKKASDNSWDISNAN